MLCCAFIPLLGIQNGTLALTGGTAQPATPAPRPEGPPQRRISEHDRINNTNALELLQSGAFKLVPGKDTVPYDKLITLRLEDGVDVTRKVCFAAALFPGPLYATPTNKLYELHWLAGKDSLPRIDTDVISADAHLDDGQFVQAVAA